MESGSLEDRKLMRTLPAVRKEAAVPHLSPTTLTADEQRVILSATAGHARDHLIISLALGTGLSGLVAS
jgi:integrase